MDKPVQTHKQSRAKKVPANSRSSKPKRASNVLQFPCKASEPIETASLNEDQRQVILALTSMLARAKRGEIEGLMVIAGGVEGAGQLQVSGSFTCGLPRMTELLATSICQIAKASWNRGG